MSYKAHPRTDGTIAVYDGPHYIGHTEPVDGDEFRTLAVLVSPGLETDTREFPTTNDAIEWLAAEFRETPWADRPECQRISA